MARCPDCNKFVSYDTDVEPEVDVTVDSATGDVTAEARRILSCGECNTELKDSNFSLEISADDQHVQEGSITEETANCEHEWELKDDEHENTEDVQGKGRGAKTFYGVKVTVVVACTKCKLERVGEAEDQCQASYMEELN